MFEYLAASHQHLNAAYDAEEAKARSNPAGEAPSVSVCWFFIARAASTLVI